MPTGAFLGFLIPLLGIGVVVLFIVAMIQQGKSEHGGFKQAFFTVVTLVMLGLWVGGLMASLMPMLKRFVFTQAVDYQQRYDAPPSLYLPGTPSSIAKEGNVYSCTDKCEFTADDKVQFASWKQQYQDWKKRHQNDSQRFRNDLVAPLSFLIVGLPLYFVFRRLMEQGAKEDAAASQRPTPLRSLYYYFVAFSGLIMAVVALGALINTSLRVALKAEDPNTIYTEPARIDGMGDPGSAARSILACQDKCGFTATDISLANDWLADDATFRETVQGKSGRIHDDLATYLPILLIGFPLFWYHFTRIRRETPPRTTSTSSPLPST